MKKLTIEDIAEMAKRGISLEAIHAMHDDTILCPIDRKTNLERSLNISDGMNTFRQREIDSKPLVEY